MQNCLISRAENGWIAEWIDDGGDEPIPRRMAFQIPDDVDENLEDPQALIDLLYFIKEQVCCQCFSKHKRKNVVITMEDNAQ